MLGFYLDSRNQIDRSFLKSAFHLICGMDCESLAYRNAMGAIQTVPFQEKVFSFRSMESQQMAKRNAVHSWDRAICKCKICFPAFGSTRDSAEEFDGQRRVICILCLLRDSHPKSNISTED
jgi:hypothetical protein